MKRQAIATIFVLFLLAGLVSADSLLLPLSPGDNGKMLCAIGIMSLPTVEPDGISADCDPIPTPSPSPTPGTNSGELLANWQLYNDTDGQGNLFCNVSLLQTAPFWTAQYFSFRGPWNEDPSPDGCVARTMGEEYPDNSGQTNHIPAGETGILWQVAAVPGGYDSAVVLQSVYGQHESGAVHWSVWDCPDASGQNCSLIYRTNTAMRVSFLTTKVCSAYDMTLMVEVVGTVSWNADRLSPATCGIDELSEYDTTAVFTMPSYLGVLFEVTPKIDPTIPPDMSGVKIGDVRLSVE